MTRFRITACDADIDAEDLEDMLLKLAEYFDALAEGEIPDTPFAGGLFNIRRLPRLH
jgi:hypothetical protein